MSEPTDTRPKLRRKAYSLRAAAAELGVDHKTLANWIATGNGPKCLRIVHGTGRVTVRISTDDFEAFKRKHAG